MRNDEDNKPSLMKKAAVLAGIGGAVAFNKLGGRKLLADNAPKISRLMGEMAEDLSGMERKDFTADNIGSFVNKHLRGSDSTLRRVMEESTKHTVGTSGNSLASELVKQKEIEINAKKYMRGYFNSVRKDEIVSELHETFDIEKKEAGLIDKFVSHVYDNRDLIDYSDGGAPVLNEKLISKYFGEDRPTDAFFDKLINQIEYDNEKAFNDFLAKSGELTDDEGFAFINNVLEKFNVDNLAERHKNKDDDFFTGLLSETKALTVSEYLARDDFEEQMLNFGDKQFTMREMIEEFAEKNPDAVNMAIDAENLRVDKSGNLIDTRFINEKIDDARRDFAGTLPGKIFKTTDRLAAKEQSSFNFFGKRGADLVGESLGTGGNVLTDNYVEVLGKFYRVEENQGLTLMSGSKDFVSRSSKHGTVPRMMKKMAGAESAKITDHKLANRLDIGLTTSNTIIDDIAKSDGPLSKRARAMTGIKQANIVDGLFDFDMLEENPSEYRRNAEKFTRAADHITKAPSRRTISQLEKQTKNEISKDVLNALKNDDVESMVSALSMHTDIYENKDLTRLLEQGVKDRQTADRMLSITSDKVSGEKRAVKFKDMIRKEAFKEVLIQEVSQNKGESDYSQMVNTLKKAGIKGEEFKNAKNLAYWGQIQKEGNLFRSQKKMTALPSITESNRKLKDFLSMDGSVFGNAGFSEDLVNTIKSYRNDYKELMTSYTKTDEVKTLTEESINNAIMMRKGYSPRKYAMDMIENLNKAEFDKAKQNSKRFGMQFVAGRNSSEYITEYTTIPYFFTQRLVDPFEKLGLGLSNKNTGSVLDEWKAIMLKRVAPTAGGIAAFSYLNYRTKAYTGTSITGAMAQGVANVDLGVRKIADATGVGGILDKGRTLNPITQYWFGEEYQNAQERKDYYENGYDEVRKGRWWAFGSASEFRGGKISYYQPNFVKRANSDWKDVGLYGSVDEKWKHSWLPTPRHPLAPLRRLYNPYWLEKKHYDDRPYMETAPLFSSGTPWGNILNPTVGQIIKPVKKMHQLETKRGLTDPRTLIAERNEIIKAKAIDKSRNNLVRVNEDGISNISFTPKASANPSGTMVSLKVGNGEVQSVDYNGIGYEEGLPELNGTPGTGYANSVGGEAVSYDESIDAAIGYVGPGTTKRSTTGILESTTLGAVASNEMRKTFDSQSIVAAQNNATMRKAAAKRTGFTKDETNLATMPAKRASAQALTKQDEADLRLTTSRHDFINDTIFSAKQLSGIYGFMFDSIHKDRGRKIRLENAEKMSSFKTSFWDANIGGVGGGVMEIARRFFPHEDHSITNINPIRNTMPEWMPSRFLTGDPYTKVSKGEMRLPGAGYESIHKLRPDQFGQYGALDRMRILGDIAPWSDEYKLWRDMAQKTVTDKAGKDEIEAIKKRVEKQSKNHEFYNYKYLHTPTEMKHETVDTVNGTTFTTTSGKTYNMAGVTLGKNGTESPLHSGMHVNVETLKGSGDSDEPIDAAVYLKGENLNQKIVAMGGKADKSTVMGAKALTGHSGRIYGATMEAVAHAPIPFVHNKLMRIDTPLDSYKNERVYGTPYSTWDHPIKGFVEPAFQKSFARGPVGQGLAVGAWVLAENVWKNSNEIHKAFNKIGLDVGETAINRTASVAFNVLNPGAFAGSMMASIPKGALGGDSKIGEMLSSAVFMSGTQSGAARNGARIGASIMLAGYGFTRSDKPIQSTAIFSMAGAALAEQLKYKDIRAKDGAIIGAAAGFMISAIRNPKFDKEKMFGKYVPENTKKQRDIEEYYDRLEYIKYMGLYEKAARKAKFWEKTDIKKIINSKNYLDKVNAKKIDSLNNRIEKISNSKLDDGRKQELIYRLNDEIARLQTSEQVFRAGKYTKAAIAYKEAADSTIYGLTENATQQQVLRAVSKGEKDYFMEFMKEKDRDKQKEILKYVSPYQRRALQIAWGSKKIDKVESNASYFKNHFLPGTFWAGWNPRVDLENVKIKTIENEGMLLSDFGIYESQANEPSAIMAPSVGKFDSANTKGGLALQARLQGALKGSGLTGVKVSVSPSASNGIEVIANVTNGAKIMEYNLMQGINKTIGTRMFY